MGEKKLKLQANIRYQVFVFAPSGKKYVGVENLIKKMQEDMVFNTKNVKQIKRKGNSQIS